MRSVIALVLQPADDDFRRTKQPVTEPVARLDHVDDDIVR